MHGGASSIRAAQATTQSDASAFFQSRAYAKRKEWLESGVKIDVAVVERLNGVIRGLGIVAKRM